MTTTGDVLRMDDCAGLAESKDVRTLCPYRIKQRIEMEVACHLQVPRRVRMDTSDSSALRDHLLFAWEDRGSMGWSTWWSSVGECTPRPSSCVVSKGVWTLGSLQSVMAMVKCLWKLSRRRGAMGALILDNIEVFVATNEPTRIQNVQVGT